MSTTVGTESSPVAPEVRLFLARVRHELADLDPDEVSEMTDGLEADLTELVADRGPGALGSPAEYAEELRLAAGLDVRAAGRPGRRPVGEAVNGLLDAVRRPFEDLLDRLPADVRPALVWPRPLWWILRGWIAMQVVLYVASGATGVGDYGDYWQIVPDARGWGLPALIVAVAVSVLVGVGRLWPGGRRTALRRTVLLVVNLAAICLVPTSLAMLRDSSEIRADSYSHGYDVGYQSGYSEGASAAESDADSVRDKAGVYVDGHWVSNIYPYDASGKPLVGVQLFDQTGKPIGVVRGPECADPTGDIQDPQKQTWSVVAGPGVDSNCDRYLGTDAGVARVSYPWTNGAAQVDNVYPLATRQQESFLPQPDAFTSSTPPAIGAFPLANVPPVSLPGITPSVQQAALPEATKQDH